MITYKAARYPPRAQTLSTNGGANQSDSRPPNSSERAATRAFRHTNEHANGVPVLPILLNHQILRPEIADLQGDRVSWFHYAVGIWKVV